VIIPPSQGSANYLAKQWPGHSITGYNSAVSGMLDFDPSYGTPLSVGSGGLSAETQYSLGLAGFEGPNNRPLTFGQTRWWNTDPLNLDINFSIAP
jgi:hypothetical protein